MGTSEKPRGTWYKRFSGNDKRAADVRFGGGSKAQIRDLLWLQPLYCI
jgi:hypothetical protein